MTMAEKEFYITVSCEAEAEFEEKRSRFIGTAAHVKNEDEAREFTDRIAKKYKDATHNVYAYYLEGGAHARYSDDGEPQGTAGMPVLEIIKKSGGDDIAVVVTRYFGGVKLGAGGLVRAYAEAAKLAIEAAGIVTFRLYTEFSVTVSYTDHRLFESRFSAKGVKIDGCDFSADVTMHCAVLKSEYDSLLSLVNELSSGRITPTVTGQRYDFE